MTDAAALMAVDGTGLFVRCAKAGRHTGMTAPDGTPTGAAVLFTSSLAAMVRELQPTHLMIAWDSGLPGTKWRRRICPGYKAKRPALPHDLREFEVVRQICDAAQIAQWAIDDFEADDLLAAFCRRSRRDLPDGSPSTTGCACAPSARAG
jgi:DNA polymerase-1